ncbi:MAG: hypothetical protein J0H95_07210 [Xanthomonadales bacterium]|nr:hypothetical protein [Xanthomonadales bacterium]
MEPKKKHYAYIIAASYIYLAVVLAIKGEIPTNAAAIGRFLGGGLGIAIFPLIATRFLGNAGGWIIFVLFSLGHSVSALNWLPDHSQEHSQQTTHADA